MPIVECPRCHTSWRVANKFVGTRLGCHWCRQMFVVPSSRSGTGSIGSAVLLAFGVVVFLFGLLIIFGAMSMTTTVNTDYGSVHNIGLLQAQQSRLLFGIFVTVSGGAMVLVAFICNAIRKR